MKKVPFVLTFALCAIAGAVFGFIVAVPSGLDFTVLMAALFGGATGSMVAGLSGIKYVIAMMEERQP